MVRGADSRTFSSITGFAQSTAGLRPFANECEDSGRGLRDGLRVGVSVAAPCVVGRCATHPSEVGHMIDGLTLQGS